MKSLQMCLIIIYTMESKVIKSENLKEESISEIALPYSEKYKNTFVEKYRDIIKKCVIKSDKHYTYFLLGIENQSEVIMQCL